ncbi:hypothetical protein SBADM41S_12332 [Streptomyces badius]
MGHVRQASSRTRCRPRGASALGGVVPIRPASRPDRHDTPRGPPPTPSTAPRTGTRTTPGPTAPGAVRRGRPRHRHVPGGHRLRNRWRPPGRTPTPTGVGLLRDRGVRHHGLHHRRLRHRGLRHRRVRHSPRTHTGAYDATAWNSGAAPGDTAYEPEQTSHAPYERRSGRRRPRPEGPAEAEPHGGSAGARRVRHLRARRPRPRLRPGRRAGAGKGNREPDGGDGSPAPHPVEPRREPVPPPRATGPAAATPPSVPPC